MRRLFTHYGLRCGHLLFVVSLDSAIAGLALIRLSCIASDCLVLSCFASYCLVLSCLVLSPLGV